MNKEKMEAAKLMFKGMVKGTIVDFNPNRTLPYNVTYTYRNGTDVEQTDNFWVSEESVFPRTDNELLENLLEKDDA